MLSVTTDPNRYLQQIHQLACDISGVDSAEYAYAIGLDALNEILRVPRAAILLFDDLGVMRFVASRGLSNEYQAAVEGHSPWNPNTKSPEPVLVEDVAAEPTLAALRPTIEAEGIRSLAFFPLVVGSVLVGKFMLYYGARHGFEADEVMVAETIAAQVAYSIQRERSLDQQRHLQALFQSTTTGIAKIGPEGQFLMVNDTFCGLVGRPRTELLQGLDCLSVTHPDDRAETAGCLGALRDGTKAFTIEKRFLRPDGSERWVSCAVSEIRDERAQLLGATAIVTDVTERRRAEELVKTSEERYRTLVGALGVAVYTADADGYLAHYNEEAVELWGRRPVLGQEQWCGSWKIYAPDGRAMKMEDCPMGVALREGRAVRGREIVVERPDGSRANVLPYPTPLRDHDGQVVGAVNVLVDITELRHAQDGLKRALREKDDFLGQVSHELRTPLTPLVGNASILLRRWDELSKSDRNTALFDLHDQALRLQRLVENMMVLSRLERGLRQDVEPQLVQRLAPLTVAEFQRRFEQVTVETRIETGLPPVDASASTIDQVLWNLLTNAQKYGGESQAVEVTARLAGPWVELLVRDHGPGVADLELPRLFEPYFRSSSNEATQSGLGLGLSVCRRLVEAEGGEMWAVRRSPGMEFGVRLKIVAE